jgi:lysophospholipase L1-like esterase
LTQRRLVKCAFLTVLALVLTLFSNRASPGSDASILVPCRRFTAASPNPVPQSDQHATERFQAINEEAESGPHAVLFLGDSLTEKWDTEIWQKHFASLGALNAGVNGDRTEHLLWRLKHGNLDGPAPKVAVLLIGTNDIGRNRPPEVIAEGVRTILEVLRSRLPAARVLLLGVLPRSESSASPRRQQVREVNQLIRGCADGEQIIYADLGKSLLDPRGRLTSEVSPDGVHLSERGYALLATTLDVELDRLLAATRGTRNLDH